MAEKFNKTIDMLLSLLKDSTNGEGSLKYLLCILCIFFFSHGAMASDEMVGEDCGTCQNELTLTSDGAFPSHSKYAMSVVKEEKKSDVVAGKRNMEPMPEIIQIGFCAALKDNKPLSFLNEHLASEGRQKFDNEYKNIKCTARFEPRKDVGPFKVLVNYPSSLSGAGKTIFRYYHKTLKRLDLLRLALNTPDEDGLTILDYHSNINDKVSEGPGKKAMSSLRRRLCAYGATYSLYSKDKNCDDVSYRYK